MSRKIIIFIYSFIILSLLIINCDKKEPKDIKNIKSLQNEIKSSKSEISQIKSNESLTTAINNNAYFNEYNLNRYKYVKQNDLADLVNGADGTYISKGVIEAGSLELIHKINKLNIIITVFTVFTVDKNKDAKGIYLTEKSGDLNPEKIGTEGYFANDNNLLVFWKSKYYIKIEILKRVSKDEGKTILLKLGEIINKMIPWY